MTKPIRLEHLQPCMDWWGGADRQARVESEVAWRVTAETIKARVYKLKRLPVAVPPLAEQRRIAIKVAELMVVCDQLEAHLESRRSTLAALLEATLSDALTAS